MWISDNGNFWNFKVRMTSDVQNLSFTTNGEAANAAYNKDGSLYDCKVNVEGGKVLPGQGLTPHGTPADSIVSMCHSMMTNRETSIKFLVFVILV